MLVLKCSNSKENAFRHYSWALNFNCDSKLIYRSVSFFSEILNLQVGASCWRQPVLAVCLPSQRGNWGYFKAVFCVLYICDSGENYFFGNYMKYRSDRSKKFFFRCYFRSFFKFSTPILAKLGHCSAIFWHFEGAMHALWLLMTPRKFWKKKWKCFNFSFFFSSNLDQRAWLWLNLTSCSNVCVKLILTIILWLEPITFWSWNIEFFYLRKI